MVGNLLNICGNISVLLCCCLTGSWCFFFTASTVSTLKVGVTEKKGVCVKLRQQLEALEKETAAKLAEMDQYNKDMQVRIET